MRFDFAIGNPPYQESYNGESTGANSVYDKFLDSAYEIADKVEMIHPARFLFNAGSTPKAWNRKMLEDEHIAVKYFEQDSSKVFSNTDIKGGIAITYRDIDREYGAIGTFTPYERLNDIFHKVIDKDSFVGLNTVMVTSSAYHFTDEMHNDYPTAASRLSKGHEYDLKSNAFERLPDIFHESEPNDGSEYIQILGRCNNDRAFRFIKRSYINNVVNLSHYKLFFPKASGTGVFGETIAEPIIGLPYVGATETFLSIGSFDSEIETLNAKKYIKTKFARAMLGVLKITQDVTPEKWKYIPLQDFTPSSDIDWSVSIPEIDKQLYKKYGLSEDEIEFIETKVKEME